MKKHAAIIAAVGILGLCRSSYGLTTEQIGPDTRHPTVARQGWPVGIVEIPRHISRVYSTQGGFGNEDFYFKCKIGQINELLAIFAKARMRDHVVRIEPGVKKTSTFFSKEEIEFNVHLRVVSGIALALARGNSREALEPQLTILTGDDDSVIKQLSWPGNLIVESRIRGVSINKDRKKPKRDVTDVKMVDLDECTWTVTSIRSEASVMREMPVCFGATGGLDEEFKPEAGRLSIVTVTLTAGKTGELELVPELFLVRDGGIYGLYRPCRGVRIVNPKPSARAAAFHPPSYGKIWPGHAGQLRVVEGQPVIIELLFTQIVRDDAELLAASPVAALAALK
jgi:hypothetical protein